jgi:hypothetical protein
MVDRLPKGSGWLRTCLALAAALLHTRELRRQLMFYATLAAMLQLFAGLYFFDSFLTRRPLLFATYWAACFALVSVLFLLASYDLLAVRREARRRERELRDELGRSLGGKPRRPDDGGEGDE